MTSTSFAFGSAILFSSQTRSQAPEYAQWPKMAYSIRIIPQVYFLLLKPYYARNSAGGMSKAYLR